MTKWTLAVGVATLALSSLAPSMAMAGPGGGHGGGGDQQRGGGGGEKHGGGGGEKHGGGGGERMARPDMGFEQQGRRQEYRQERRQEYRQARRQEYRQERRQEYRHERQAQYRPEHQRGGERFARNEQRQGFVREHGRSIAYAGAGAGAGAAYAGTRYVEHRNDQRDRGLINGCPPGLAAKDNGCMPPGQVRSAWGYGAPLRSQYADAYLPGQYRAWYPDNNQYYYRYGDGYAYRVGRSDNLVSGLFPLSGNGYYAPGELYPAAYDIYNIPQPYQSYYPDNGAYDYRYGDGAIYQVNQSSGLVESIVALLTGGGYGGGLGGLGGGLGGLGGGYGGGLGAFGIGQALPAGYDVYNVPDPYRDRYYDTADENYRYADGNIYRVDPKTQVIQAIISALT